MKKTVLLILIFVFLLSQAYADRRSVDSFTLEIAQREAYWYSLYNVAHLTMFSGLGNPMKAEEMAGLLDWLKGGGVKKAELVKDMNMISSVYKSGAPHFIQPVDLNNKKSLRWSTKNMDRTLEPAAQAFTIIKSVTKNFHRDYHETIQNQRVAIAMYPEAIEMAELLAEKMVDGDGLFVTVSPDGKKGKPNPLDQVAVLWAFSDLALVAGDPEIPPYVDSELLKWSTKMADEAFRATKTMTPRSIIDKALAIEAYGRYAAATGNPELRLEAIKLIKKFANQLLRSSSKSITEMGLSVYGLGEAYRVLGDYKYLEEALKIFNRDMEQLWNETAGVYAPFKGAERYVYTPFDAGAVLAAFNTVLWFAIPSYESPHDSGPFLADKRYTRFFESLIVISGMQQSSGISLVEEIYPEREPELHFAHPALPNPEKAGGSFGKAPVYAGEVTYENGKWRVTDDRFRTMEAMFLANMSVILNRHQADCFIPIERLTAKLLSDAGI